MNPVCDKNCLSCIHPDCICDDLDYEDYKRSFELDNAVLREKRRGRRILTDEERKERSRIRVRLRYKRLKEQERAKHTNVFECGNENVLRHWKEWRRKKGG